MERAAYELLAHPDHWWFRGRRAVLQALLAHHAPPAPRRVLELGCGTGANLPLLAGFGEVQGIEDSPEARALVAPAYRARVRPGALPDRLDVPPGQWDWVCLFDVLEHVDDDVGALAACRALLAPGGAVIVTVPAYRWLWGPHDTLHHHRRRYTRARLLAAAAAAGLAPAHSTYFNTLLFPLAALARLKDRLLGGAPSGTDAPPAPVNAVFAALFAAEARWLRRWTLPFGVSLAAVLRAA